MYALLFNLRHVIHILSVRVVNLLCQGGHFSNITCIDAETKYRSLYLLEGSQLYLQNHIRTSLGRPQGIFEGRPQDVGRTRPLDLNIRPCGDVLITSARDVLKTLVGDASWRYIQDHMGISSGRPRDVILPSGYIHYIAH